MSGTHTVVHDPLTIVRNGKSQNISDRLIDSTITGGVTAVTEITLELHDPAGLFLSQGLFEVGVTTFDWHIFKTTLAALEISGGSSGQGQIRAQFRSRFVRNLKRRRGPHSEKNVTASDYVERECKRVGLIAYTQKSSPAPSQRKQIARDVPKEGEAVSEGAEYPSAWTTFQRLAGEEGYLCFEFGGILYFGTPEWCMSRRKEFGRIEWVNGRDAYRPLEMPTARRSEDATIPVEMSVVLPRERYLDFRPGWRIQVNHFRGFEGAYIVNSVTYDLNRSKPLSLEIGTAVNPVPTGDGNQEKTERGVGPYKHIVDAAIGAGWSGVDLQVAVAVAIAESNGDPKAVSPPNTQGKAAGSRDHGLWQINDYYHDFDAVLIYNSQYNAKQAYAIWKARGGGTAGWAAWSTHRNGAYQKHMSTAASAIETSRAIGLTAPEDDGSIPSGGANPAQERDLSNRTIRLRRAVVAKFGEFTILGWGTRPNRTEHDDRDPRTGEKASNALDLMTYTDMKKGQAIADFLAARSKELEIDYVIWNRRINTFDGRGWRYYGGPNPHTDHPHVSVNR